LAEFSFSPFSIFGTKAMQPVCASAAIKTLEVVITSGKKNERKKMGSEQMQMAVISW
jgi:hypothetical protein